MVTKTVTKRKIMDVLKLKKLLVKLTKEMDEGKAELSVLNDLFILRAVAEHGIKGAVHYLNISAPTVYKVLKKYDL